MAEFMACMANAEKATNYLGSAEKLIPIPPENSGSGGTVL